MRNLDWNEFVKQTGFTRVDVAEQYDFALSFAGEDRQFAEKLHDRLADLDCVVFYDHAEQHRILAENLEDFLGPIYSSDATFVVAVLGPTYGQRRWTHFESQQFRARFGERRVIPVWAVDALPTGLDVSRDVGGVTFDPTGDLDTQAAAIAELCAQKLDDRGPQTSLPV